jgi:hypothetical protein
LIFEMATRSMLFARFQVVLDETGLSATVWGEPVDVARHCPAVEPKGATFTELAVRQMAMASGSPSAWSTHRDGYFSLIRQSDTKWEVPAQCAFPMYSPANR